MNDKPSEQVLRERDREEARRIGLRLRALRKSRGMTQAALAEKVGMVQPQLCKIEGGTFDLRVSTVRTLLRALDCDFSALTVPAPGEGE